MSGTLSFGGSSVLISHTDNWVRTVGITTPKGRAAANGVQYALNKRLLGYARGRGASRSLVMSLGSAVTDAFTIASAGAAASTGWQDCSGWLTAGGSAIFELDFNGSTYFGRSTSGTSEDSYGGTFAGTLGGSVEWIESPNSPTGLAAVSSPTTPGAIDLSWNAPSDNGGASIEGYRIQYSTSPTFASGVTTIDHGTSRTRTITGLTPGVVYYFRVAAKNEVTELAGTTSTYSSTDSALVLSGMKVWNGSSWRPASVRVWDGSAWRPATVKVWNGSAWENAS